MSGLNTQMASELNTSIFEAGNSSELSKDDSYRFFCLFFAKLINKNNYFSDFV